MTFQNFRNWWRHLEVQAKGSWFMYRVFSWRYSLILIFCRIIALRNFWFQVGLLLDLKLLMHSWCTVDAQLMHSWCTVAQFRNWSFNCTGCCVLGRSATTGAGLRYFNKDDACLAQWLEQIHFCNKFFKKSTKVGTFVGILFWQISYCFFVLSDMLIFAMEG